MKAQRGRKSPLRESAKFFNSTNLRRVPFKFTSIKLGLFKGAQLTPAQLFMGFIGDDGTSTQLTSPFRTPLGNADPLYAALYGVLRCVPKWTPV